MLSRLKSDYCTLELAQIKNREIISNEKSIGIVMLNPVKDERVQSLLHEITELEGSLDPKNRELRYTDLYQF